MINSPKDLTSMVLFTGKITDLHIESMKSYPWIFFNDLETAELEYDIATKNEGRSLVSYNLTLTKDNDMLDKRFKALEDAIRLLFWKEVKIQVKINGKEAYKSG